MVLNEQNLKKALEQPLRHGVYYYYSTEEYLVRSYAAKRWPCWQSRRTMRR